MGIYTIFYMFENPRTCRQGRNLTTKISKILDLKSSSEQIFSENCRWVPLNEEDWTMLVRSLRHSESRRITERLNECRGKVLHGQILRKTEDVRNKSSWDGMREGDLEEETDGMITVAQRSSTENKFH